MRFLLTLLFALVTFPAWAITCGTKNVPVEADFVQCVSPAYSPTVGHVDGAASTADAYSRYQWNMRQILEGESYNSLFSDAPRDVIVAVIGAYPGSINHPDLVANYLPGKNFIEGGTNTSAVWDGNPAVHSNAHDQCSASIIASVHNSIGTAGVFHRAKILPIRADFWTIDDAIDYAVAQGAEVIHMTGIDGPVSEIYYIHPDHYTPSQYPFRPLFQDATVAGTHALEMTKMRRAINDASFAGVVFSTAIGNQSGKTTIMFLPSLGETIATQATNVFGESSPFNSTGHMVDIMAPGGDRRSATFNMTMPSDIVLGQGIYQMMANQDDILCATGPSSYSYMAGGSPAGPHTAGAMAIIKSYLPDAKTSDVRRLLTRSMQPFQRGNLHLLRTVGGMLSLKRLRAAIADELNS